MSAEPKGRKVDLFLRTPHHPHQYVTYAAVRLHDDGAVEEALLALEATPLPPAPQAERDRNLLVLRRAATQVNPVLARRARWRKDAASVGWVLSMGAPDCGGTVWLHEVWHEMVNQFAVALSHRAVRQT